MKPKSINDTEIHTWFERDRQHVELRDKRTDKTLIEWWDEDVTQAVEDGFLNPRDYHRSAFNYWQSIQPKRGKTMRENPLQLKPLAANQTQLTLDDGTTVFFSYKTPVAAHIPGQGYFRTEKKWSATTSRHISNFLRHASGSMNTHATVKPQEWFDTLVSGMRDNPKHAQRNIEISQQAGIPGYHVFVDGLYDTDIAPSKSLREALKKAEKEYKRIGPVRADRALDRYYYK